MSGEGVCCFNVGDDTYGDCDERIGTGPAIQDIYDFIGSETVWLAAFLESWTIATENGYTTLYTPEEGDDPDDVVATIIEEVEEDANGFLEFMTNFLLWIAGMIGGL